MCYVLNVGSTNCKVLFTVPWQLISACHAFHTLSHTTHHAHTHTLHTMHTHTVPSAPRNVRVFTDVVVWGPPQNPNGIITGYEVKFSGSLSGSESVNKEASESYHIISDTDLSRLQGSIEVEVS